MDLGSVKLLLVTKFSPYTLFLVSFRNQTVDFTWLDTPTNLNCYKIYRTKPYSSKKSAGTTFHFLHVPSKIRRGNYSMLSDLTVSVYKPET